MEMRKQADFVLSTTSILIINPQITVLHALGTAPWWKQVVPQSHKKHTEICERIHWPKQVEYVPIPKKDRFFEDYKETGVLF